MKEELIKELVANSKFTNRINLQYQQKIELLEKENIQLKADIDEMQRNIHRLSPTIGKDATKVEMYLFFSQKSANKFKNQLNLSYLLS